MTPDPTTEARFFEQIAGDFPETELHLPGGIVWTRQPITGWWARTRLWVRWIRQGHPHHRGIITRIGHCWQTLDGGWYVDGWAFCGDRSFGVPTLHVETIDGRTFLRAVCGWHLLDLQRVAAKGSTRRRWVW